MAGQFDSSAESVSNELSYFTNNITITTNGHSTPRNGGYACSSGMCLGPRKFTEALSRSQRETLAQTRRLEEMIGDGLQLPPTISTGFLYVMDATGRRHTLTMDMAHSFEVCLCVRYELIFMLYLLKISAIYRSS